MENWTVAAPAMVNIPAKQALALLNRREGNTLRLYLHMQLHNGRLDKRSALAELEMTEDELRRALTALQRLGMAEQEGPAQLLQSDKRPEYAPGDLTANLTQDDTFKQLADDVSHKLGKILSNTDLTVLLGLYDWLGLPADVICLLVVYCMEEAHRRFGAGRVPTLRQIEKTAIIWEKEGLITAERAENWMVERERNRRDTGKIARILQIIGRKPTATEENYISQFAAMGFPPEIIYDAYDKTVTRCGRLEWRYLHTILKNWKEKGVRTLDDIERQDKKPAAGTAAAWEPGDFELEAVRRMGQYKKEG